ncbi:uncharacterized protein LOC127266708 [Andrographis paniculata]|uniref:uncharacterized protein LOC127266708 n=1 Tax=Andrographis paniculata TaxID=175694 RepID=UPI0021E944D9|nr:uncharacterized protein LOC127266708 [Andrographis paniculata]
MAGICVSEAHLVDHLVSDLIFVCSFVRSRLLYFCYLVFLLPYVLKLLAFLYPLFVTSLLVLAAVCVGFVDEEFSGGLDGCRVGYLAVLYESVADRLHRGEMYDRSEEFKSFQEFGLFEMLFGSSIAEVLEESPVEGPSAHISEVSDHGDGNEGLAVESDSITCNKSEKPCAKIEEKRLENFLKILDQFERMASSVEEKKNSMQVKCTNANKVVEKRKAELPEANGSEAASVKVRSSSSNGDSNQNSSNSLVRAHSQTIAGSTSDYLCEDEGWNSNSNSKSTNGSSPASDHYSLATSGSMRKEKEWKRTLACKLFEERHSVGGGEGMDSLWEAYEMDSSKSATAKPKRESKKDKNKKEAESYYNSRRQFKKEEDEQEDIDDDGQLCCLQALKLSTGKMNLGMGRPNLVKITKAIKGLGWLHQITKHSKKVHNTGDRY